MKTTRIASLQRLRRPERLSRQPSTFSDAPPDVPDASSPVRCFVGASPADCRKYVERFVLLLILANCVALGFESHRPGFEETTTGKALDVLEIVFLTVFTAELLLKMIALGLFSAPDAYFRDGWNLMDFVVIVLGWVAFSPSIGNYSSIRAIRVLRSLRTITGIPGMRKLVGTLLQSLPMLLDVVLLCAFAYFVFGIVGVQVFSGALIYRCGCPVDVIAAAEALRTDPPEPICAEGTVSDTIHWTIAEGQIHAENENGALVEVYACSEMATEECPDGLLCAKTGNPYYGMVNFDNILSAWLTIFQVISMEGWTDVMYAMQDAVSQSSWLYFFVLIIIGSLFAVNLALAVLYLQFISTDSESECSVSSQSSYREPSSSSEESLAIPVTSRHWLQTWCCKWAQSTTLETLTMALIVMNVVVMAADYYGMPEWQRRLSEVVNMTVAVYFLVEMVIKLTGLGWRGYIQDRMHLFDGIVALAGMLELLVALSGRASGVGGSLYVFRVFRLLRIFKLSRSWKELNKIVTTIHGSIASMANLCLIFLLFIVVMALLGMQLFGYRMQFCHVATAQPLCPPGRTNCPSHPDCYLPCRSDQRHQWIPIYDAPYNRMGYCEEFSTDVLGHSYWAQVGAADVPRHNFDTFFWSFLTAFQILTGENWNEVMYDLMRSTSYWAALYCVFIIIVGNYILLNLFLAILLDNFAGVETTQGATDEDANLGATAQPSPAPSEPDSLESGFEETESSVRDVQIECTDVSAVSTSETSDASSTALHGRALFLFAPENAVRRVLLSVVSHRLFDQTIVLMILCSSILLALESPSLDEESLLGKIIHISDALFVLLFATEALIKTVVMGFIFNGPGSYLRDKWNVLDFFILCVGVLIQIRSNEEDLKSVRALRALRCLKPLRLASRNKGIKVVINSLFQSVPPLLNVALVCLLFFLTFAILGINLLKGEFYFCADSEGNRLDGDVIGAQIDRAWCEEGHHVITRSAYHASINITVPPYTLHHSWENAVLNFDWIGSAMLALFEMSTLEMWLGVMYNGIDAVGIDQQPERDFNIAAAVFYVVFIITGAFFVLNLFVSVTIDKFHEIKHQQEGRLYLLTKEQEDWVITQRYLWVARPLRHYVPPKNSWRRWIFDGVNSTLFELLVMAAIFINVIAMACTHHDMESSFRRAVSVINAACALFFLMEVAIKLIGLGPRNYFRDGWNVFDFVVTALSMAGSPYLFSTDVPLVSGLRVFRVVRLLRLIPKATGLRTLFQTLAFSFPALFNVGGVLSLFFFIYAVVGVQLFGRIRRGAFLNRHANFENFGRALLTLFRMSTGESWNGIMHDAILDEHCLRLTLTVTHNATTYPAGTYFSPGDAELASIPAVVLEDQCNANVAVTILYFCSFILIVAFILLNVVIAVILDNFQTSSRKEHLLIKVHHIEEFAKTWSEIDPDATWYIPTQQLPLLLFELSPPLGIKGTENGMAEILAVILSLEIPDRASRVHFLETLHSLMGHAAGTELPLEEDLRIHEQMLHLLPKATDGPDATAAHYHSGKYVQASIRGFLIREKMAQFIKRRDWRGVQKLRSHTVEPRR